MAGILLGIGVGIGIMAVKKVKAACDRYMLRNTKGMWSGIKDVWNKATKEAHYAKEEIEQ